MKTVNVMGFVDSKELISIYLKQDIIIIPSRFESFSNVALEAMGFGCIVVVSDKIGMAEHIVHGVNGFIFKSDDFNSLKRVFTRLIKTDKNTLAAISESANKTARTLAKNEKLIEFYKL